MAIVVPPFVPSVTILGTDVISETDDKLRTIINEAGQYIEDESQSAVDQMELKVDNKIGELASVGDSTYTTFTIDNKLGEKVNVTDIQNILTSIEIDKPLSAAQGKVLKDLIDALSIASISGLQTALDGKSATSHTHSNKVSTTSSQALHSTDALRISGSTISLYKGNGASESVDVPTDLEFAWIDCGTISDALRRVYVNPFGNSTPVLLMGYVKGTDDKWYSLDGSNSSGYGLFAMYAEGEGIVVRRGTSYFTHSSYDYAPSGEPDSIRTLTGTKDVKILVIKVI